MMICFDCKENHPLRKPPTGAAVSCQTVNCDYCGDVKICFPDRNVFNERPTNKIEQLKREVFKSSRYALVNREILGESNLTVAGVIIETIDHLVSLGYLQELEEVEGLREAHDELKDFIDCEQMRIVMKAAKIYLELLEKQRGQKHE